MPSIQMRFSYGRPNITTSLNLNPTRKICASFSHIHLSLNALGWSLPPRDKRWWSCGNRSGRAAGQSPLDLTAGYMRSRAIQAESHIERERAPSEKLPSICQLSSCGNIFKWTLFILFDSLSEPGTMRRELGQWRHSGPLLRVRWVQMYN